MNKEYLEEIYENNKEKLLDSEQEINSFVEFVDYIKDTISSNIQYDFNFVVDIEKLLNLEEKENVI